MQPVGLQSLAETDFASVVQPAIQSLGRAFLYADSLHCDPWQFAVEIRKLLVRGLTTSDLRWLVMKGYVEHARETTRSGDSHRRFQLGRNLAFSKRTCFVLTELGLALMQTDRVAAVGAADGGLDTSTNAPAALEAVRTCHIPHYDIENRTLHVFGQIVKQYRVPSPNQEAILAAFQEEKWPAHICDPLAPLPETPPKLRLRETIRCLNANQKNGLIRFFGDGTGEGVRWSLSDNARLLLPYLTRAAHCDV